MGISQYEAFVETVERGSLTKAAEALGYTQSGVTHMLDALERELGVRLLNRGRTGTTLTSEGEVLLPHVRAVINQQRALDEHVARVRGLTEGLVRVGTFTSVSAHWLPGIIAAFQREHPGVRFQLVHGTNQDNERAVREGRVDVAFVLMPAAPDLLSILLARDPIVGVVPAGSEVARAGRLRMRDLADNPYIQLSEGVDDEISALMRERHAHPDTRFVERDDYAAIAMVEKGLGLSVMPQLSVCDTTRDVAVVPLDQPAARDLGVCYRGPDSTPLAAQEFIRVAQAWVRDWRAGS